MDSIIASQRIERRRRAAVRRGSASLRDYAGFRIPGASTGQRWARGTDNRLDFLFLEGGETSSAPVREFRISSHALRPAKRDWNGRKWPSPRASKGGLALKARLGRAGRGIHASFKRLSTLPVSFWRLLTRRSPFARTRREDEGVGATKGLWDGQASSSLGAVKNAVAAAAGSRSRVLPWIAALLFFLSSAAFLGAKLLGATAFPQPSSGLLPDENSIQDTLLSYVMPETAGTEYEDEASIPLPPAPLETRTYTVRSGDSIASVAKKFGLRADTLISMNGIREARSFRSGAELKIPNMDGLLHKVKQGESLNGIARRYGSDTAALADANDLGSSTIQPGQTLFIPGARLSEQELKRIYGEKVIWPARGPISSYFGYRPNPFTGVRQFHSALDIVLDTGTPVKSAMDGKVADSGYNSIFGNYIIINHSEGFQTLYAHLSSIAAVKGKTLTQGTTIGLSGNSGYSTGPHLHFGLFKNGTAINPLKYLK